MKVERKRWDDVTILHFVGEFDAFNLPTYSEKIDAMLEGGENKIIFNLRLLTFINSSALGYLLKVKKRAQELGGDLVLVQPSKFIKKTLLTLGLQEVFRIHESDEDGVFSFSNPGSASMKLTGDDAEKDEKLVGANAIMYRIVDEEGKDLYGQNPQVGRITALRENSLEFRWDIPAPGPKYLVPLSTENFESAVHPGTRMRVKFRQPFAMKSHYFEMGGLVTSVHMGKAEGGGPQAQVDLEFQDMKDDDRASLLQYVQDMAKFRDVLSGSGESV